VTRPAAQPDPRTIANSLVGPGDPPPFHVANTEGRAALLLVCDHASRQFPAAMRLLGLGEEAASQHIAWDIGAADLSRALARRFDAPALLAGYSRLLIDCNRALTDATSIVSVSDGMAIPGNAALSPEAGAMRVRSFFDPYHAAIEARLEEFKRRAIVPVFLSVHSFTPVMGGVQRPWHIGVLWDRDPRIALPLLERLRARGDVVVGDNLPYSGRHPADYTVARHAERAGLPHVCIEMRQDLLSDAAGVERWAGILHQTLEPILSDPRVHSRGTLTPPG
jgi:predicted N-formylglutamate amidohydrolase